MIYETVDLYAYFGAERKAGEGGILTVYAYGKNSELNQKVRPAMLVVPGGGYGVVSEREGEPVAATFLQAGFSVFLLRYSVNAAYPVPLNEAAMAMAYIRLNAEKYHVDAKHVCAAGFSAGGHLTGMLATLFAEPCLKAVLGKHAGLVRPDAVVLSYPVITTEEALTHAGTAEIISGGDEALRRSLAIHTRVTAESSPAFVWHTAEDGLVPVENSLMLAKAYREKGVPFELHIFEKGWHGLSVVTDETENAPLPAEIARVGAWVGLALSWLHARGFSAKTEGTERG